MRSFRARIGHQSTGTLHVDTPTSRYITLGKQTIRPETVGIVFGLYARNYMERPIDYTNEIISAMFDNSKKKQRYRCDTRSLWALSSSLFYATL